MVHQDADRSSRALCGHFGRVIGLPVDTELLLVNEWLRSHRLATSDASSEHVKLAGLEIASSFRSAVYSGSEEQRLLSERFEYVGFLQKDWHCGRDGMYSNPACNLHDFENLLRRRAIIERVLNMQLKTRNVQVSSGSVKCDINELLDFG